MATYLIVIKRSENIGSEEYDGGHSIADARKEAAFFVANTPAHVPVRIVKVVGNCGQIQTVEYARQ